MKPPRPHAPMNSPGKARISYTGANRHGRHGHRLGTRPSESERTATMPTNETTGESKPLRFGVVTRSELTCRHGATKCAVSPTPVTRHCFCPTSAVAAGSGNGIARRGDPLRAWRGRRIRDQRRRRTRAHVAVIGDAVSPLMAPPTTNPAALHAADSLMALPSDPRAAIEGILSRREEGGFTYFVVGAIAADACPGRRRTCRKQIGRSARRVPALRRVPVANQPQRLGPTTAGSWS